jgi:hypothetical protein
VVRNGARLTPADFQAQLGFRKNVVGASRGNMSATRALDAGPKAYMKEQLESPRELNPPPEMLARATFALAVAAVTSGILLTIVGVVAAQLHVTLCGLLAVALGWSVRAWIRRRGEQAQGACVIEQVWDNAPTLDEARAVELMTLLEQWEAEEEKRGTPQFDPWALQTLRNEIRKVVESDPGLEQLFTRLRQAA